VSVNNVAVKDPEYTLSAADLLPGGHIILRKGKKSYHVLRVAES
jgi:tyrosyl-tRNA synthetase